MVRECGPCTACCEGWLTAESLDMKPGQPCRHCTRQGCAIYDTRPEDPCVRFECGWLQEGSLLPDDLRPDLSGVIVLFHDWRNWKAIFGIPAGQRVPDKTLESLRKYAQDVGMPLIFYERLLRDGKYVGVAKKAYGSLAFADAVRYSLEPEDIIKM